MNGRSSLPWFGRIPGAAAFAALSRRVRTLLVSGVLFLVLFILVLTLPVPYVILSPGPTYNTLGSAFGRQVIIIKGVTPRPTTGNLNLSTVVVSTRPVSAFAALLGWLRRDDVVVPRAAIIPPGTTENQINQQNTADFVQSQDNAIVAACGELHYPKKFGVTGVLSSGAAYHILQPADVIETLDGKMVNSDASLRSTLAEHPPGTTVTLGIERLGKQQTVRVTLGPALPDHVGGSLGITPGTVCAAPFSVSLGLANEIGGPSAGLMFALGIIDKVGPEDLTGGRFVAGTGTIDTNGKVGKIGGIQLKMIADRNKGATVFLAPVSNCADVLGATPSGLQVISVDTLHHARQALLDLQQGKPVPHC